MPRTTPFHEQVEPLNQTGVWKHWSGYLVAPQYQYSLTSEYYAIRNAAAVLDTSPLFKYRFTGQGARPLLERVLARDVGACAVGRAQYTCWCDERGYVLQDGVVVHVAEQEYLLTAAEPALRYFRNAAREMGLTDVEVEDISDAFGILALQGPHAYAVLEQLTDVATPLRYFGVARGIVAGCDVVVSRTGYTGDLGYELWIRSEDAGRVWDALMDAGQGHNITPIGDGAGCFESWTTTVGTSSGARRSRPKCGTARVGGIPSASPWTGTTTSACIRRPEFCRLTMSCTRNRR